MVGVVPVGVVGVKRRYLVPSLSHWAVPSFVVVWRGVWCGGSYWGVRVCGGGWRKGKEGRGGVKASSGRRVCVCARVCQAASKLIV